MTSPTMVSFTERVYKVFALASDVATSLGHNVVSPTHMALGVLREGEGVAVSALHLEASTSTISPAHFQAYWTTRPTWAKWYRGDHCPQTESCWHRLELRRKSWGMATLVPSIYCSPYCAIQQVQPLVSSPPTA